MNLGIAVTGLVVLLVGCSFAYSRWVEPSRYGVPALASALIGGLLWAHLWLVLHVALSEWAGLDVFALYSAPSALGWLLTSAAVFSRYYRLNESGPSRPGVNEGESK